MRHRVAAESYSRCISPRGLTVHRTVHGQTFCFQHQCVTSRSANCHASLVVVAVLEMCVGVVECLIVSLPKYVCNVNG